MSKGIFTNNDLVFYNEDGKVKAGGYVIDSPILQKGGAAIKNLNVSNGDGVKNMAIPAGLFLVHKNENMNDDLNIHKHIDEIGTVKDGLFDKLFNMIGGRKKKKKRTTRRKRHKSKRKTRKR